MPPPTTTQVQTPEAAATEHDSRGPRAALVALAVAVVGVATVVWIVVLVVVASWFISGLF